MANELEVWLFADQVGTLSLDKGRLTFRYASDWLLRPDAVALSVSLPLHADPFDDRQARPFFAGLLPEGQLRRLIARQFQVSGQNDFALLEHIGGECAGAVTFVHPGQDAPVPTRGDDIQWLSDDELAAILDELPRRPMLAGEDGLRLSLAGAHDKLPVVFDRGRIGLPRNGTPSSHILKPAIHAVPDSVINERFCMALADAMQLKPAKSAIHAAMGRPFLLVERYDRATDDQGRRLRLHQEDFCQALGVVPETKYQNEGGPGLPECFDLVRQATRPSAPHVLRLFDYVIFNGLIGNHDAHAKNFSLLHSRNGTVLAPLYDALSTAVYPALTQKMAMKLGGKYKFSEIHARHWERFADSVGVSKAQARRRILELTQALPPAARQLQSTREFAFAGIAVVDEIIALIEQRCAMTGQRLSDRAHEGRDTPPEPQR